MKDGTLIFLPSFLTLTQNQVEITASTIANSLNAVEVAVDMGDKFVFDEATKECVDSTTNLSLEAGKCVLHLIRISLCLSFGHPLPILKKVETVGARAEIEGVIAGLCTDRKGPGLRPPCYSRSFS